METTIQDANTDTASSTVSEGDVKTNVADSSVATTQDTTKTVKEQTIADVAKAAFDKAVKEEASTSEVEGQESDVQSLNNTEEEKTDAVVKEDTTKTEEEKTEEQPPFHEHPRWKEVVSKRDELQQEVERYKPVVESHQKVAAFCESNGITPEDYQEGLQMIALSKRDPMAFYQKLKGELDKMAPVVGESLPTDLQKAVDDGEITLGWAQKLAKEQAKSTLGQRNAQLTVEQRAAQAQDQFRANIRSSLQTWESNIASKDADFVQGSLKHDMFMDNFSAAIVQANIKNPQDAVAVAVKAYAAINERMGKLAPRNGVTKKPLSSTKSSTLQPAAPKTIADVVKATAARHGLSMG